VSEVGALVRAEKLPGINANLLIRLRKPVLSDWTTAKAVREGTSNEVGLEFTGPTPYDLILGATLGIDLGKLISNLSDEDRCTHSGDKAAHSHPGQHLTQPTGPR
jgi:hypothetical protein